MHNSHNDVMYHYYGITCLAFLHLQGHGRLVDPPARNVLWEYGYDNPRNVDLNQLNCGGTSVS